MRRVVWVLSDSDEGVMGVFVRRHDAIEHLRKVDPAAPLEHRRHDGSLCDFAMRYRLEAMRLRWT